MERLAVVTPRSQAAPIRVAPATLSWSIRRRRLLLLSATTEMRHQALLDVVAADRAARRPILVLDLDGRLTDRLAVLFGHEHATAIVDPRYEPCAPLGLHGPAGREPDADRWAARLLFEASAVTFPKSVVGRSQARHQGRRLLERVADAIGPVHAEAAANGTPLSIVIDDADELAGRSLHRLCQRVERVGGAVTLAHSAMWQPQHARSSLPDVGTTIAAHRAHATARLRALDRPSAEDAPVDDDQFLAAWIARRRALELDAVR